MSDFTPLQIVTEQVIGGGYCVGCGACAAVKDSPMRMKLNEFGQSTAFLPAEATTSAPADVAADVAYVCPFSGVGPNEDEIAKGLFGETAQYDARIGFHRKTYAGYVAEGDYRKRGSSGGMGSWLAAEMLKRGLVDAVVHVGTVERNETSDVLFQYSISRSVGELKDKSKSKYYPFEFSRVVEEIRHMPGRYAFVGVPCFIKAVRLLCHTDELVASRIRYTVGLVCGHLKSANFAAMFAWQSGVHPDGLEEIDFRHKLPGKSANRYGMRIRGTGEHGERVDVVKPNSEFFGTNWGHGLFKYQSCDYCDDVMAETADVVIGDAWLPEYVRDSRGTNIVVVRNAELDEMIALARSEGRLSLDDLSPDDVARSQDANYRHRRDGLRYRLYLKQRERKWAPRKRVEPAAFPFTSRFRRIQRVRVALAAESHVAFQEALQANDYNVFVSKIKPLVRQYENLYRKALPHRVVGKLVRVAKELAAAMSRLSTAAEPAGVPPLAAAAVGPMGLGNRLVASNGQPRSPRQAQALAKRGRQTTSQHRGQNVGKRSTALPRSGATTGRSSRTPTYRKVAQGRSKNLRAGRGRSRKPPKR